MLTIDKRCAYKGNNYNLLPAILYTPPQRTHGYCHGHRLAFKWWNFHLGIEWSM